MDRGSATSPANLPYGKCVCLSCKEEERNQYTNRRHRVRDYNSGSMHRHGFPHNHTPLYTEVATSTQSTLTHFPHQRSPLSLNPASIAGPLPITIGPPLTEVPFTIASEDKDKTDQLRLLRFEVRLVKEGGGGSDEGREREGGRDLGSRHVGVRGR